MGAARAAFDEAKHPRGYHGRFGHGAAGAADAKAFLDQHYGAWRSRLTAQHEKALRFYQSPGFALMNGQLRGLKKSDIRASMSFNDADLERARKASADLQAAIDKAPPLTHSVTVFRGFSADQFGELKPGMVVEDKGFTSTSLTNDAGAVGAASSPAVAEIVLPPGTKAAAGSSRELILPPGTQFRIVGVSRSRGKTRVRMEVVPASTKAAPKRTARSLMSKG